MLVPVFHTPVNYLLAIFTSTGSPCYLLPLQLPLELADSAALAVSASHKIGSYAHFL